MFGKKGGEYRDLVRPDIHDSGHAIINLGLYDDAILRDAVRVEPRHQLTYTPRIGQGGREISSQRGAA